MKFNLRNVKRLVTATLVCVGILSQTVFGANLDITTQNTGKYIDYPNESLVGTKGYYKATAKANIRKTPYGDVVGQMTTGWVYYVLGECPDCYWYKVMLDGGQTAYVYASYLTPANNPVDVSNPEAVVSAPEDIRYTDIFGNQVQSLNMIMVVNKDNAKVYQYPNDSSAVVAELPSGLTVHVAANVLNTPYYQIVYNGQSMYIHDDTIIPQFPQQLVCTASPAVYVRSGPGSNYKVIGSLNKGDKINAIGIDNGWVIFTMPNGNTGYVTYIYTAAI